MLEEPSPPIAEDIRLAEVAQHPLTEPVTPEAVEIERLLTQVLRGLFRTRLDDPLTELTQAQIRMMRALEAGPESASLVGENLSLSVSAVTQVANRLETLGLIERTEGATDKRVKPLALTHRGRSLLEARNQMRIERAEAAIRNLKEKDKEEIIQALTKLNSAWQASLASRKEPIPTDQSSTEELTSIAHRLAERSR